METYCTIPLVLDFMSRKFTKGLPSLRDTEGVLLNNQSFTEPGQTLYGEQGSPRGRGKGRKKGRKTTKRFRVSRFQPAAFIVKPRISDEDPFDLASAEVSRREIHRTTCAAPIATEQSISHDAQERWSPLWSALFCCFFIGPFRCERGDFSARSRR